MSTHNPDIVRYHTAGRRQPQLIGKDPSGVPIWGGPYTLYQVAGLAVIPAMWQTRGLWAGSMSGIAVIAVIAMTTAAVTWLLGRIDFSGRNIIYAAGALLAAWTKTLRPARRSYRPPGIHVTGHAVHARTPKAASSLDASRRGRPVAASIARSPDLSVQPNPPIPAVIPANGPVDRLSPLEAFLAAADKVKVPCP